jgi:hypothetical protein
MKLTTITFAILLGVTPAFADGSKPSGPVNSDYIYSPDKTLSAPNDGGFPGSGPSRPVDIGKCDPDPAPVPEPASIALLGLGVGVAGLGLLRRKKK